MKHKCLSIAGFDGSGGAGIQADLKTFSAFGCYGMSVLTAIPVQNTCGVRSCYDIPLKCIEEQLETIFDDIIPDSIKIGMLFSAPIIKLVANFLEKYAYNIPIILDPVMVAKSGDPLLLPGAIETLKNKLIPITTIITPNLPEAYRLTTTLSDVEKLGELLLKLGSKAVLLKGGHANSAYSNDFFLDNDGNKIWLKAERINSKNTHGTGCTLSAAICSSIALGFPLIKSCQIAKSYLWNAMKATQEISVGRGKGPVNHFYHIWPTINKIMED
jgi:hydroxymethylpyrimidine/phosphomethylpyrimidine kinase